MKKNLLLPCIFMIVVTNCLAQTTRTLYREEILKGRVKQVTESGYEFSKSTGGVSLIDTMTRSVTQFDEEGNTTRVYDYSNQGKLGVSPLPLGSKSNYITIPQNQSNNKQVFVCHDTIKRSVIRFDSKGLILLDSNLKAGFKTIYIHDKKGKISEERFVGAKGKISLIVRYSYDKQGHIKEQEFCNGDGSHRYSNFYKYLEYDSLGNWTKRTWGSETYVSSASPETTDERKYIYY